MNKEFDYYIDTVIKLIGISGKKARQIREDLYVSLVDKQQSTGEDSPYSLMGEPEEVAAEFRENLEINERSIYGFKYKPMYYTEYISKTKVFGVPLVHINTKPFGVAKGIISFGTIAMGILSFGAISIGALSFGGLSAGLLLSTGGAALSGGMSIGGAAIAYGASIGGLAIAKHLAFGGYAAANIAVGGVTKGVISIFRERGTGQYLFKLPADKDLIIDTIKSVYPNIGRWVLNIIKRLL